MNPINNSNLLQMCRDCGAIGFTPVVGYVYDAAAKTVVLTDGSTIPAGDALSKVHVRVHDTFGGEVRDAIVATGGGGAKTLDVSTLDASKGLNITVTVLTTGRIAADGSAFNIGAAGNISRWDVQKNA